MLTQAIEEANTHYKIAVKNSLFQIRNILKNSPA